MKQRLTQVEFEELVRRRQRGWRAGHDMGPFPTREEIIAEEDVEIVVLAEEDIEAKAHYSRLPCGCPLDSGCNSFHSIMDR